MRFLIGLMSGTSADGVDAALIKSDGVRAIRTGIGLTIPYAPAFRAGLRALSESSPDLLRIERDLTLLHAKAVVALLERAALSADDIFAIGFHGHTLLHRPDLGRTLQIGDGALLAQKTGVVVVNDFRTADMAAGGQGAPLVPLYHQALAHDLEKPLAILNLGGVGNVTWLGEAEELIGFDTGPANALIDDWADLWTGRPMDQDGALARKGRVDQKALAVFLSHPYFAKPPPKSLDRDDFKAFADRLVGGMSPEDGAATLTAFTLAAVRAAAGFFPKSPRRWLVCGGGRKNPVIMEGVRELAGVPTLDVDALGWDGDSLEAEAFAYLAARHMAGLPTSAPGATGASRPMIGGRRWNPA